MSRRTARAALIAEHAHHCSCGPQPTVFDALATLE